MENQQSCDAETTTIDVQRVNESKVDVLRPELCRRSPVYNLYSQLCQRENQDKIQDLPIAEIAIENGDHIAILIDHEQICRLPKDVLVFFIDQDYSRDGICGMVLKSEADLHEHIREHHGLTVKVRIEAQGESYIVDARPWTDYRLNTIDYGLLSAQSMHSNYLKLLAKVIAKDDHHVDESRQMTPGSETSVKQAITEPVKTLSKDSVQDAVMSFEKAKAIFDKQQSINPFVTILDPPSQVLPEGFKFENGHHKNDWEERKSLHRRLANPRDTRQEKPVVRSRRGFDMSALDGFELGHFPSKSFVFPKGHRFQALYNMTLIRAAFNQATSARDESVCEQCRLDPRCYEHAARRTSGKLTCFTGSIFCKVLRCFDFKPGTYAYAYERFHKSDTARHFSIPEWYPDNEESWI